MAKAVIYRRCSTQEQADSGLGLDAQLSACQRAAQALGLDVGAVCTDAGVSGSTPLDDRPGLIELLRVIRRKDTVIVARRDRIARDALLALLLEKELGRRGVRLVSADGSGNGDGPADLLMRRLLDAFGEFERAVIRARTKAALQAQRERGRRFSRWPPYGYAFDAAGNIREDRAEQVVLALARALRAQGCTVMELAAALNAQGYTTRAGGPWRWRRTYDLLTRRPVTVAA